jgi:hypothetical protein
VEAYADQSQNGRSDLHPHRAPRKLVRQGPAGLYPAVDVQVSIHPAGEGGEAKRSTPSLTGADGMYYLSNIPEGDSILEVRTAPDKPPLSYPIRVKTPYTDVPQIRLP